MSQLKLILAGSAALLIGITAFEKVNEPSATSFVEVPTPAELESAPVVVAGLPSCPHSGQQTKALLDQLTAANIPHKNITSFSFEGTDDWQGIHRLNEIMKRGAPIVFVNGKAKSNPNINEVIAEYRQTSSR